MYTVWPESKSNLEYIVHQHSFEKQIKQISEWNWLKKPTFQ